MNAMKKITYDEAANFISKNSNVAQFGGQENAVSNEWIDAAEKRLGIIFPISYKWFLNNYGGGEIGGDEIYSVYGQDFDLVQGGDIVHMNLLDRSAGLMEKNQIVISKTDFGEVFYFDYSNDAEPIIKLKLPSGESIAYAVDFLEFLIKRIKVFIN